MDVYLLATVCTCSIVTGGSFTIWTHCIALVWESPGNSHNLVSLKPVASQIVTLQQPHLPWEVDQKLGHKSPPVQATSNLSMTSYRLIKARAKQCPTTLCKEDQGMTLLENRKEHLVSRDKTKVMIACDHAQYVAVQQEDQTTKTPGMN